MKPSLASIWTYALQDLSPVRLIGRNSRIKTQGSGLLFWGKAARAFSRAVPNGGPRFVISLETADHPLPGSRSFRAGLKLLEFFSKLQTGGVKELAVFLSGGASSLAWLRPPGLTERALRHALFDLYGQPLTIRELNRRRAKFCLLKAGGALRLLKEIAPGVRCRVYVISDVAPFGPEVVGSGPFRGARHVVLADNRALVKAAKKHLRGERVLLLKHSQLGTEKDWACSLEGAIARELSAGSEGVMLWGGEPQVSLPAKRRGRGGRQTQIAARLALRFWEEICSGRVEILCASSDGADGSSGASACDLRRERVHSAGLRGNKMAPSLQRQLKKAVRNFDTAPLLRKLGVLIPARSTGTNLQDLILIRIRRTLAS